MLRDSHVVIRYALFVILLSISIISNAQTSDGSDMDWSNLGGWSGTPTTNFQNGILDSDGANITINGQVTAVGGLTVSAGTNLMINDILIVDGDLDITAGTLTLHNYGGGVLIVTGNLIVATGASISFDNSGLLIVSGDYTLDGSDGGGWNGSEYVLGTITGSSYSSDGDENDLISNESADLVGIALDAIIAEASGDWSSTATWGGGVVPVDGDDVIIPSGITVDYSGSLSLTSGSLTVMSGGKLDISAGFTANTTVDIDGVITVGSTYTANTGSSLTMGAGSYLIVFGGASSNQTMDIAGSFRVSGSFSYTGSNDFSLSGSLIVGGNITEFSSTGTISTAASSMLGVYGETSLTSNPFTDTGDIISLGYVDCTDCGTTATNPKRYFADTGDNWDVSELGIGQIWWEDFTTDDGATNNWSYTDGSVTGGVFTGVDTEESPIWETGEITTSCYSGIQVSADISSADASTLVKLQFQYSIYTDAGWSDFAIGTINPTTNDESIRRVTGLTGTKIKLRLVLLSYVDETFNLDNVSIAGTLTLGDELNPLELVSGFDNTSVCTNEEARYELTSSYDTYSWAADDNGVLTTGSASTLNVTWAGVEPMSLQLEVGNGCGRSLSESWPVTTSSGALKVALIDYTDLDCFTTADGMLEVAASCGTPPYSYSWTGGLTGAQITNLEAGSYTVTVTDAVLNTTNATYSVGTPDEIEISLANTSVTSSCDATIGCNGIAEFEILGGDGNYAYSLTGGPSDTVIIIQQKVEVRYISDYYTVSGYQLPVEIVNAQYVGMLSDYSDVRFFEDAEFTTPLDFWLDPESLSDADGAATATFYVNVDLAAGVEGTVYFTYGDPSMPGNSCLTCVLDVGNMYVRYFDSGYWTDMAGTCEDDNTQLTYDWPYVDNDPIAVGLTGPCASGIGKTSQETVSLIWSGWYTVPAGDDVMKIVTSYAGSIDNGTVIVKMNYNTIPLLQVKNLTWNFNTSLYDGETVYIEIFYSKSASEDGHVEVAFAGNTGNGINNSDDRLVPANAYSRKILDPEPEVTLVKSARYEGLCESLDPEFYYFTVTDGNGCSKTLPFEIWSDAIAPEWDIQPATYNAAKDEATSVTETLYYESMKNLKNTAGHDGWAAYRSSVPGTEDWTDFSDVYSDLKHAGGQNSYIQKTFDTQGFSRIKVQLNAFQSPDDDNGWDASDYLRIEYSLNGGSSWSTLMTDYEIWNGGATPDPENFAVLGDGNGAGAVFTSDTIDGARENANFMVRIRCLTNETDENFYLQSLSIIGDNMFSVDPLSYADGYATVVADDADDTEITFRDYVVGSCNSGYTITRTWTATDDCGNTNTYDQTINIAGGDVIAFEEPDPNDWRSGLLPDNANSFDYVHSFCKDTVKLVVPSIAPGGCDAVDTELYYLINHNTTTKTLVSVASGEKETISLAIDATTTISWYAIDGAGFPLESTYSNSIEVHPVIDLAPGDWTYDSDFCEGDAVAVTVAPTGGSGDYTYNFSTSLTGSALVNTDDEDGNTTDNSFTTSNFMHNDYIYVDVTDDQGCSVADFESPGQMTVRPPLETPGIQY